MITICINNARLMIQPNDLRHRQLAAAALTPYHTNHVRSTPVRILQRISQTAIHSCCKRLQMSPILPSQQVNYIRDNIGDIERNAPIEATQALQTFSNKSCSICDRAWVDRTYHLKFGSRSCELCECFAGKRLEFKGTLAGIISLVEKPIC